MAISEFDPRVRILICGHCGKPAEVSLQGGQQLCSSCGQPNSFGPRPTQPEERTVVEDPGAHFARLRQQDGKGLSLPSSVAPVLKAGRDEQVAVVAESLGRVREGAPFSEHERLFFLAFQLPRQLRETDDLLLRAILESAVEALDSPRYRQVLRGLLARHALRTGTAEEAEAWLAPCDPSSDDLLVHSAVALARAEIATSRGDWSEVLRLLGSDIDEVPTADAYDEWVELIRANALERQGKLDEAVRQLKAGMKRSHALHFDSARKRSGHLDLCPGSYDLARKSARGGKRPMLTTAIAMIPMLIFPVMFLFSGTFLKACAPTPYDAALDAVNNCQLARDALGQDITGTMGVGCGNMETGGGSGYLNWSVPVRGTREGGTMAINATQRGGTWVLDRLLLETEAGTIDVLNCR